MDIEPIIKMTAVAGSVLALYKVINELIISKKSRLRDEFKFIKEFIADLKSDPHPFVIEKGYQAVTGGASLNANEIKYLLSLSFPGQALKKYTFAREYVEIKDVNSDGNRKIVFREKYTENKRKWAKRRHLACYILFATLAFVPIPFSKEIFGSNWQVGIVVLTMTLLSFGPLAFISLIEFGRFSQGEELVAMQ